MKKLLLCTLIASILCSNLVAQVSKTPNMDALRNKKRELEDTIDKINKSNYSKINEKYIAAQNAGTLQDLYRQLYKAREENNNSPEMNLIKKEKRELEERIRTLIQKKYPEIYVTLTWSDKGIKIKGDDIYTYTTEGFLAKILGEKQDTELEKLDRQLSGISSKELKLTTPQMETLNKQIEARLEEFQKEAQYQVQPELKDLDKQFEEINKKLTQIDEDPGVIKLQKQIDEMNQNLKSLKEKLNTTKEEILINLNKKEASKK
jgi:hypothetical protein